MTFPKAVSTCFQKYITFQGRAPRSEYWYFTLFGAILATVAKIIEITADLPPLDPNSKNSLLVVLTIVLIFPAMISVTVRRLHDLNRSGWWLWLHVIPILGLIVLLSWYCQEGTDGDNRFGSDPLHEGIIHSKAFAQGETSPSQSPRPVVASISEELAKLAKLRTDGVLTDHEFSRLKDKLIGTN